MAHMINSHPIGVYLEGTETVADNSTDSTRARRLSARAADDGARESFHDQVPPLKGSPRGTSGGQMRGDGSTATSHRGGETRGDGFPRRRDGETSTRPQHTCLIGPSSGHRRRATIKRPGTSLGSRPPLTSCCVCPTRGQRCHLLWPPGCRCDVGSTVLR